MLASGFLLSLLLLSTAEPGATLESAGASLHASETAVVLEKGERVLFRLEAFRFNYERFDEWQITRHDDDTVTLHVTAPASIDYYRPVSDTEGRDLEITISRIDGGFRLFADPEWGRQVTLEFEYLGDHFFGLAEPLQPDNRLTPDLTGASIVVDVKSEAASFRENYASAFSAFFISSHGYGAFYDTFARGEYAFAKNGTNRIHHETGTLDWYVFVGDTGTEIHRHYFALIGKPKYVPLWGLGPIAWRDQNDGGAEQILDDVARFAELRIPLTGWFVDRPYSDGNHAWSKMNFNERFAHPEEWIGTIREEYGLEFMTWVSTATFGDLLFEKHLGGRYSYLDLSHPPTVKAYQRRLKANQYDVGVRGHKVDRTDEVFPEHELWQDGTPLPERRNKYTFLVAKTIHEALQDSWQDQHFVFARAAYHRTQPFLSAVWGGDPRSTWEGFQGTFANAIRTSFLGFPVWGTDTGGYLGEGLLPEDLYLRWMQATSMAGFFEIKLDGSGGQGRDRVPWRYDEEFRSRFRKICEERMAFLPYLHSLASTSATTGVLMKPMAYQHLDDENTWGIWDQFYLGDAILVAPVFTPGTERDIYLPKGQWRNFDRPSEVFEGGRTLRFEADLETLPRFIRENSIYVLGSVYAGNSSRWKQPDDEITVFVNPASRIGSHTFLYVEPEDLREKPIRVIKEEGRIHLTSPALSTAATVKVFMDKAPKSVSVNGRPVRPRFEASDATLEIPLERNGSTEVEIALPVPDDLATQVRAELLHAWRGYERYAWGHDELAPLSRSGHDWHEPSLLLTPVDALDTLILAGFDDEATKVREYLASHLRFDPPVTVQVFEVTIRLLGGLLSSYQMTDDERLLDLAEDLGERLLPAFDSPTGMPYRYVNLATGETSGAESNPAEIGTLILEFGTLAKLTGREKFYAKAKRALVELHRRRAPETGLPGEKIDVETGEWTSRRSLVGARIDSYYEYLVKCERLFGDPDCAAMWRESRESLHRYLADERSDGLWYGEADMTTGERTATRYGALHAFLPGLLALEGDLDRARRLQESGFRMWRLHGIEPEVLDYETMEVVSPAYQLRPEIIESAYVLHELTGEARYREMGRVFFESLKRYCRTESGYAILTDVVSKEQGDRMHSFFLAETLKYLYLLYAPDALDFDQVVFNTEAHPLRRTW